jgi:hypothetical protein
MKLYQIPIAFSHLEQQLEASDGELSPEMEADLDKLEINLEQKINGLCGLIAHLQGESEVAKGEADRLDQLAFRRERTWRKLKEYLLKNLELLGRAGYETSLFKIRICNNSRPSIRWDQEPDKIPAEFVRTIRELDGQAAYRHWQAYHQLPEGFVVELGRHLRIS